MSTLLLVTGLSWQVDDKALHAAFAAHGEVVTATVILDPETGRSCGFGFVRYAAAALAEQARERLSGELIGGRPVAVDLALELRAGPDGSELGGFGHREEGHAWVVFEDGYEAVFDTVADPGETTNRIDDYAFSTVRRRLRDVALRRA